MVPGPGADRRAAPSDEAPAAGWAWVLLPVSWCAWLLAWLVPSLLLAPHIALPRPWMTAETAPAAALAAGALFLVVAWPFWPALAGRAGRVGGPGAARWIGLSVLEFVTLVALALPFGLVAWSVGGWTLEAGPTAAAVAGLGLFGLGLRVAAAGMAPAASRWLMLAATLACVLPPALEYAAGETLGVGFPRVLDASPVVALVRVAAEGWPAGSWPEIARLWLWPGVGLVLALVGVLESRRRGRAAS